MFKAHTHKKQEPNNIDRFHIEVKILNAKLLVQFAHFIGEKFRFDIHTSTIEKTKHLNKYSRIRSFDRSVAKMKKWLRLKQLLRTYVESSPIRTNRVLM